MIHDLIVRFLIGLFGTIIAFAIIMPILGFVLLSVIP